MGILIPCYYKYKNKFKKFNIIMLNLVKIIHYGFKSI